VQAIQMKSWAVYAWLSLGIATITVLIIIASLALRDYTVELKNGYTYEHWGSNFIAKQERGNVRQIIESQVDRYMTQGNNLLAIQENLQSAEKTYWLLNMQTDQRKSFKDQYLFISQAQQLGINEQKLIDLLSK
jgi:predicted RNA-binding protein associated with RNAse of E/G family